MAMCLGQVTDPVTNKPISDATVVFDCQGSQKVFYANENGFYYASNIPACVYTVSVVYFGKTHTYPDVKVVDGDDMTLNMQLALAEDTLPEIPVVIERYPLMDPLNPTVVTMDKKEIGLMVKTDMGSLTEVQAGVTAINGDYYVHGARAGSLDFYIDGCRIMGSPEIPVSSLEVYRSYTGFLPPKYGDTTGGAVVIETRSFFSER